MTQRHINDIFVLAVSFACTENLFKVRPTGFRACYNSDECVGDIVVCSSYAIAFIKLANQPGYATIRESWHATKCM